MHDAESFLGLHQTHQPPVTHTKLRKCQTEQANFQTGEALIIKIVL